jgi:hypothetical protein
MCPWTEATAFEGMCGPIAPDIEVSYLLLFRRQIDTYVPEKIACSVTSPKFF